MARRLRLQFKDAIYHVINRGNYRRDVFDSVGAAPRSSVWLGGREAEHGQGGVGERVPLASQSRSYALTPCSSPTVSASNSLTASALADKTLTNLANASVNGVSQMLASSANISADNIIAGVTSATDANIQANIGSVTANAISNIQAQAAPAPVAGNSVSQTPAASSLPSTAPATPTAPNNAAPTGLLAGLLSNGGPKTFINGGWGGSATLFVGSGGVTIGASAAAVTNGPAAFTQISVSIAVMGGGGLAAYVSQGPTFGLSDAPTLGLSTSTTPHKEGGLGLGAVFSASFDGNSTNSWALSPPTDLKIFSRKGGAGGAAYVGSGQNFSLQLTLPAQAAPINNWVLVPGVGPMYFPGP